MIRLRHKAGLKVFTSSSLSRALVCLVEVFLTDTIWCAMERRMAKFMNAKIKPWFQGLLATSAAKKIWKLAKRARHRIEFGKMNRSAEAASNPQLEPDSE